MGGSNNGKVAAVGMFLDKKNENMDLVAKKSWFLLEDKLINLGSGISGTTNATIETILDNRMMDSSNMQIIQKKTADSTWINLTSTNPLNNLGYIFPNTMSNVDVQKEIRSGKYLDINEYFVNDQSYTKEFVKIIKNHGSNAQNDTYEYLTVAGKTAEEMAEMAQHKSYNVLANTPEIQAIETKDYLMLNAWSGNQQAAFVHVSEPASIIAEKLSNDTYRLSIANPVQNNKVIEFSIEKEIIEVIEKESEITMDSGAFLFDSKGLKGSSRSITIKVPSEVDKTALEKIVEENQNRNESDYTKESWKVFTKAMELAQAVLTDPKATQAEVDDAVQAVRKAIEQLQEVTKVDKTALKKLVEENQNRVASGYTAESWQVFRKALEAAQAVLADSNTTQAEVDEAIQAVNKAIEQLQEVTKVDKTALKKLVEENQSRVASSYTAESWQVFRKALEAAQAVLADSNTTQAEVELVMNDLVQAIEQLENKETASSSEEDKNINNKAEQGKNTQEGNNEIGKSSISEETGKEGLLPKTGEKNNQVIQKLGYTILLVVFVSLFLLKGRKESKRS